MQLSSEAIFKIYWGSIFGPESYKVIWKREEKHMVWWLSYDLLSLENSSCFHMTDVFLVTIYVWLILIFKHEDSSWGSIFGLHSNYRTIWLVFCESIWFNPLTQGIGLVNQSKVWRLITYLYNVEKNHNNKIFLVNFMSKIF